MNCDHGVTNGDPAGNTSAKGRRYPRNPGEAGSHVGRLRSPVWTEGLREVEADVLADMGGPDSTSVALQRVVKQAVAADAIAQALLREVEWRVRKSERAGHQPCPSRYRALELLHTYLSTAGRLYNLAGLKRVKRELNLAEYLRQREQQAVQQATAPQTDPSASPESESAAAASTAATEPTP